MSDNACCFCGDDVGRYGHNPAPLSETGRCCDVCNTTLVIPARMSMMRFRAEKDDGFYDRIIPTSIDDIIMDEYLDEGESYEDSQEYALAAARKLAIANGNYRFDAEEDMILARMLEIEDMENPSAEDLDNLQSLESRYFEITGTFGAEEDERVVCFICNLTPEETDGEYGPMMSTIGGDACKDCAEDHGYSHPKDMIYLDAEEDFDRALMERKREAWQKLSPEEKMEWKAKWKNSGRPKGQRTQLSDLLMKSESQFPAEALEELKKHIIVFTGAGMMLSVFAAMGGFLLGRRTKEC